MLLNEEEFRQNIRWASISMVPQAAMNALNPVIRVGDQVSEPAIVHLGVDKTKAIALGEDDVPACGGTGRFYQSLSV